VTREVTGNIAALHGKPKSSDAQFDDFAWRDLLDAGRSGCRHSRTALNLGLQAGRKRLRIFGLGGRESYREVRLEVMLPLVENGNLIVNAIQSMSGDEDGDRELHISTARIEPEGVCVALRDTGHGLCPESLPHLFEPFYTTKPDGMGMGLSICRSIVEAHSGRLWATRCGPRGALFQFTIPAD
jgi:hypothetical protein